MDTNSPQAQAKLQQIKSNPLLQTLFAPYLQPGAENAQTQASTANTQAALPGVQAQSTVDQQRAAQVQFQQTAQQQLDAAKNKNGYVDPNTYNTLQKKAAAIGIDSGTFDNSFQKSYTDPNAQITYNTGEGRQLQQQYGLNKRQYQTAIDLYNKVPGAERGGLGGLSSFIPGLAPNATAYENYVNTLPANMRSQLPNLTDSSQRAQSKIMDYSKGLQSFYNAPQGLDSNYLPSQQDQNAISSGQKNHDKQNGAISGSFNQPDGPSLNPITNVKSVYNNVVSDTGGNAQTKGNLGASIMNAGNQTLNFAKQIPQLGITAAEGVGAVEGGNALLSKFLSGSPLTGAADTGASESGINFDAAGRQTFPQDITQTPEAQNYQTPIQRAQAANAGAQGNPLINFLQRALKNRAVDYMVGGAGDELIRLLANKGQSSANNSSGSPLGY